MDTCKRMWSKNEIEDMAGGGGAACGAVYRHLLKCSAYNDNDAHTYRIAVYSSKSDAMTTDYVLANKNCLLGAISTVIDNSEGVVTFDRLIASVDGGPSGYFMISAVGLTPSAAILKIENDQFAAL